jgi:ankyrin repeat protein
MRAAFIAVSFAGLLMALAPLRLAASGGVTAPDREAPAMTASASAAQPGARRVRRLERALLEAADNGDLEDVRELLDDGADANATIDGDGTALIVAAREGHAGVVRLLLDRGANPNLGVAGDGAPVIMAAREGHGEIVQLLLDRGADVDLVVEGDENALIQASGEGHLAVVKLLVSRGANVNARVWAASDYEQRQGEWRTPLNRAQRGGHRAVVAFLRSAGAVE